MGMSELEWHCQKYVRFPDFSLHVRIDNACTKVHLKEVRDIDFPVHKSVDLLLIQNYRGEKELGRMYFLPTWAMNTNLSDFCVASRYHVHRQLAEFVIGPNPTSTCHLAIQKLVSLAYPDTIAHQSLMISPHGDAIPPDPKRRLNSKSYTHSWIYHHCFLSASNDPETIAQTEFTQVWRTVGEMHFHEKHRPGPTSNVNPAVVNDGCLVGSDNNYTRSSDGLVKHTIDTRNIQAPQMAIDWYEEFAWRRTHCIEHVVEWHISTAEKALRVAVSQEVRTESFPFSAAPSSLQARLELSTGDPKVDVGVRRV
ncbi:uncharacterized protein BT62DRAFT_922489 [Guyanagaster necrorhizus]|uniref:Uncharacterized protein n=1 Tax=Guyanagaster necrorhizus TaxID=856835 RepID=A0A9P7VM94_9AGAR|nr:uncharacterized protein BT62DRAFT_922489 [Guyanagaster necrorhizus MCA 3950]KAG7442541.1 hypothetical protein BT62DRAFT_922489 [Guyanagaster necrorhizus MCA 3950]